MIKPAYALLIALLLGALAPQINAQSTEEAQKRLDEIKASLTRSETRRASFERSARDAEEEVEELGLQLVKLGRRQRSLEEELGRLARRLEDLEGLKADLIADLAKDRESLVQLIAALERLGRRPAALSLFQPKSALETAQSVGVIASMVPMINSRSDAIRTDIESLVRVEDGLTLERANLAKTEETLIAGKTRLRRLIAARREEQSDAIAAAKAESARLLALKGEAKDLEALLDDVFSRRPLQKPDRPRRQDANRQQGQSGTGQSGSKRQVGSGAANPPPILTARAFRQRKGQLIVPVSGKKTMRFGAKDGVLKAQGERLSAVAGAEVLAPFDGRVVFSAPFRDYGELLIIEHADGYHSLLAGMGQRYADIGQAVLSGEPVGAMGSVDGTLTVGVLSTADANELYLELREKGQSVDPAPWYQKP